MTQTINIKKSGIEGKFGPQVLLENGKYASFSPKFQGSKDPGVGSFQADIYLTEKGNMYINSLSGLGTDAPALTELKKAVRKSVVATKSSDVDWDGIAKGKVKSLFVEALLSNPNVVTDVTTVNVEELQRLVDTMTEYVFKK